MKQPIFKAGTMLYKPGTMAESYGVKYDYIIVEAEDAPAMLKDGWYDHYNKFKVSVDEKTELETYAKDKFGVDLDRRKSVKTLKAEIKVLENEHGN